ncbi:MAG: hypothetical protein QMB51_03830 [Patescibacteria group bacterium]
MPKEKDSVVKKTKLTSSEIAKPKTSRKASTTKDKKQSTEYHDKFLFNTLLFVAIVAIFNFFFYIFGDNFINNKKNTNIANNNIKVQNDSLNTYSKNGITFSYPKASSINENNGVLSVDNWNVNFYDKSNSFSTFEKWFAENFDNKDCSIKSMDSDGANFGYSLYFIDGINCQNNGLYMVGSKKIGKIVLGVNPNGSYEQVLASIKF